MGPTPVAVGEQGIREVLLRLGRQVRDAGCRTMPIEAMTANAIALRQQAAGLRIGRLGGLLGFLHASRQRGTREQAQSPSDHHTAFHRASLLG